MLPYLSFPRLDRASVVGSVVVTVAVLANLVAGWAIGGTDIRPVDRWGVTLAVVVGLSLAFRRRAPGVGLVVAVVAATIYALAGYPVHAGQMLMFVALYFFARSTPDHTLAVVASTSMVLLSLVGVVWRMEPVMVQRLGLMALFALPIVPVLVARMLHAREAQQAALGARLKATEAAQTAEAQRLLAEQRLEIARELHDTVAHSVATVSVQSGAALAVFDTNPEAAREALLAIRESSKAVIAETKSTLATLREPQASRAPTLDATAAAARQAGLDVTVSDAVGGGMAAPVGHAVNRIVQESVANVLRHSDADRIDINLAATNDELTLVVADNGAEAATRPTHGNGLRGMAERAELLAGTFVAGSRPTGGFEVRVELPLQGAGS